MRSYVDGSWYCNRKLMSPMVSRGINRTNAVCQVETVQTNGICRTRNLVEEVPLVLS